MTEIDNEPGVYMIESARPGTPVQTLNEVKNKGGYTEHDPRTHKATSFLRLPNADNLFRKVLELFASKTPTDNPPPAGQ